jgi:hypothetical protein
MTIKKIAKIVRETVVRDSIRNDYSIATDYKTLRGACGYASYGLYKVVPGSSFVLGQFNDERDGNWKSHAWIEVNDKIIDITASQFGITSEIYIINKKGNRARKYKPMMYNGKAIREVMTWEYPEKWIFSLPKRLRKRIGHIEL